MTEAEAHPLARVDALEKQAKEISNRLRRMSAELEINASHVLELVRELRRMRSKGDA